MQQPWIIGAAILAGAFLGDRFRLPSGILTGGMIAGLLAKGFVEGNLPGGRALSVISQLLVAYVVVSNSDVATIRKHPEILPIAVGYILALSLFCLSAAWLLNKWFGLDLGTAIYATAPGGLSGMALSAAESGVETPVSIVFQLLRLILILILTPFLAALFGK